jgi:isopenicillin N synthase-like dioxygenase
MSTEPAVHGDLPHLDLSQIASEADPEYAKAAELVDTAFSTGGFLRITGHSVRRQAIDRVVDRSRAFFTLDPAEKSPILADLSDPLTRGLIVRDDHQQFFMSMLAERDEGSAVPAEYADFVRPNRWPSVAGFRDAFAELYRAVEEVATMLMRLMARALRLPEDWLSTRFDQGVTPLVANYYPPFFADKDPARLRHPAHRDWGAMTILHQDEHHGGLQVRDAARRWVDVPIVPGSLIINLGMLMERWTGRRWVAALHRVAAPPPRDRHSDRISIAYFCQPNLEVPINRIPTCGDGRSATGPEAETSGEYYRNLAKIVYGRSTE